MTHTDEDQELRDQLSRTIRVSLGRYDIIQRYVMNVKFSVYACIQALH
jgi:hypothetical protein